MVKASIGFVMLLAVTTILLTACEQVPTNIKKEQAKANGNEFSQYDYTGGLSIIKDNTTGCQYIWTNSEITPRYASNGQVLCTEGVSMK